MQGTRVRDEEKVAREICISRPRAFPARGLKSTDAHVFFLLHSFPPRLTRAARFLRPLLFSISPAIKGAAVYNDTPSFSPYKRGGLLLGGEGRREKNRGPGVPWSSSLHVSRRYSFSVLTNVVPTNGLTRFVQQRRGLPLKKFFSPRFYLATTAWRDCRNGLALLFCISWNETDDEGAGCGTPFFLFYSLSLSLYLLVSFSPFYCRLLFLFYLLSLYTASTCGEWKEPGNRRIHDGDDIFFKTATLCFRARATFQYRIVVLKVRAGNDGVT